MDGPAAQTTLGRPLHRARAPQGSPRARAPGLGRGGWVGSLLAAVLLLGCDDPGQQARCGNGALDPEEQCDDGNRAAGDGCDARCQLESCGDGACGPAESPANCPSDCESRCGDGVCDAPEETEASCPLDCGACGCLADVSGLAESGALFFGYASLGRDLSSPECGSLAAAPEVYLCLTPTRSGRLVLSTEQPATSADTVLELRDGSCAGAALACSASDATAGRAQIAFDATAGETYALLVESADATGGVFALAVHPEGVCEGAGVLAPLSDALRPGATISVDTASSTASQQGSCGGQGAPEALLSLRPVRSGSVVVTTAHPATQLTAAALYVREGLPHGPTWCDAPEAEIACSVAPSPAGGGTLLRFEARAGVPYSLFVDGRDGAAGTATVTLGYSVAAPQTDALGGCDHLDIRDVYGVFLEAGRSVATRVDTVDPTTAADFRLRIRAPDGSELHEADDEVDCTYPPPAYRCPEHRFTAPTGGLYTLEIYVGASEQCASQETAGYRLHVEADGQPVDELLWIRDQ